MINKFASIAELIEDPLFIEILKNNINTIDQERAYRPSPNPGYKYKRDWYDRMKDQREFNFDYIHSNIEAVWMRTSELSAEKRQFIEMITKKTILDISEMFAQEQEIE